MDMDNKGVTRQLENHNSKVEGDTDSYLKGGSFSVWFVEKHIEEFNNEEEEDEEDKEESQLFDNNKGVKSEMEDKTSDDNTDLDEDISSTNSESVIHFTEQLNVFQTSRRFYKWHDLKSQPDMMNKYSSAPFSEQLIENQEDEDKDDGNLETDESDDDWRKDLKDDSYTSSDMAEELESDVSSIQSDHVINVQLNPFKPSQRLTRNKDYTLPTNYQFILPPAVLEDREEDETEANEEDIDDKEEDDEEEDEETSHLVDDGNKEVIKSEEEDEIYDDNTDLDEDVSSIHSENVIHFTEQLNIFKKSHRFFNCHELTSQSGVKDEYSSVPFSEVGIVDTDDEDIDENDHDVEEDDDWDNDLKDDRDSFSDVMEESQSDRSSIQSNQVIHFNVQLNPFKPSQRFARSKEWTLPTRVNVDQYIVPPLLEDKDEDETQEYKEEVEYEEGEDAEQEDEKTSTLVNDNKKEEIESENEEETSDDNIDLDEDVSSINSENVIHFTEHLNIFKKSHRFFNCHEMTTQSGMKDEYSSVPFSEVGIVDTDDEDIDENDHHVEEDDDWENDLKDYRDSSLDVTEESQSDTSSIVSDQVIHFNIQINPFEPSQRFTRNKDKTLPTNVNDLHITPPFLEGKKEDETEEHEEDGEEEPESVEEVVVSENDDMSSIISNRSSLQDDNVIHFNDRLNNFKYSCRFFNHMELDAQSMARDESLFSSLSEEEEAEEEEVCRYSEDEEDREEEDEYNEDSETMLDERGEYGTEEDGVLKEPDIIKSTLEQTDSVTSGNDHLLGIQNQEEDLQPKEHKKKIC